MKTALKRSGGGTEKYVKPQTEIIDLKNENVITASCGGCGFADFDGYSIPICTSDTCTSDSCPEDIV